MEVVQKCVNSYELMECIKIFPEHNVHTLILKVTCYTGPGGPTQVNHVVIREQKMRERVPFLRARTAFRVSIS